jgi:hypothetical protein
VLADTDVIPQALAAARALLADAIAQLT